MENHQPKLRFSLGETLNIPGREGKMLKQSKDIPRVHYETQHGSPKEQRK